MQLKLDTELLRKFLENDPDCSALGGGEYIADLYEAEKPMTLDITLSEKGASVLAAAYLKYDEAQDGWYMDEQISDEKEIERALKDALSQYV